MLGLSFAVRARTIAAVLLMGAAILLLGALRAGPAHAAGCQDSWTNTAGGSWFEGANWSNKAPPTEGEEACITATGTYTVTMNGTKTVTVKALTVGGASGAQTLSVASSCSLHQVLTTSAGLAIEAHGAVTMTKVEGCNNNVTLAGPITNSGTITSENVEGTGHRFIQGNVTNKGTINVDVETEYNGKGATLTNEGAVNIAGATLVASNEGSFVNAGGSINSTSSGLVQMESGTSFTEGGGTTSGARPVVVRDAGLHYTGSGASSIIQHGEGGTLSGNLSAGQSLTIESTCGEHAKTTASASFSNAGGITLTKSETCNNNASLVVSSGTLTNSGTITSENVVGTGHRFIQGNVANTGTINVDVETEYNGKGATLTNEGAVNVAGATLVASNEGSFVNAGGSIDSTSSGLVQMESGTSFTEGGGTTSGARPVVVRDAGLHYTGSGASSIIQHGEGGTLSGNLSAGQSLTIESTCGEHAKTTASASFSNAGKISLAKGETCNNNASLVVSSGTLSNSGTIASENVEGTGHRFIQGNVANTGTIEVNTYTEYNAAGSTLTNEGSIDLATGQRFVVSGKGTSVVNGTGGKIVAAEGAVMDLEPETAFTEGAGTTTGAKPVILRDGSLTYTGAGASAIAQHGEGSKLAGNIAAGQSLTIESTCGEHAKDTAAEGFTSAGSITLAKAEGCNNTARLVVGGGGTLTNTGTITSEAAEGANHRYIEGNLDNKGTLAIDSDTEDPGAAATLTNEGTIDIATGVQLLVNKGTLTNASGTIASTGTGDLFVQGGTVNQGGGKTSGEPAYLDDGALHFTGAGAASIAERGTGSVSGEVAKGQKLTIESTCGEHANVSGGSFVNNGTIVLTNGDGCGNNADLLLGAGTLENKGGTIDVENPHGGQREIEGSLKNEKTLSIAAGETLKLTGAFTQGKKGTYATGIASSSSFGVLAVTGSASIGGTLSLKVAKGFLGSLGQSYGVLGSAALTGTFAKVKSATIKSKTQPGLYYRPTYSGTSVTLVVTQAKAAAAPSEGAAGSTVTLTGTGYPAGDVVKLSFADAKKVKTTFASATANASGEWTAEVTIPPAAAEGTGTFTAQSTIAGVKATATFKVT